MRNDTGSDAPQLVMPSRTDSVARLAAEVVGGPAGRRLAPGGSWWTPVRVLLVMVFLTSALGVLAKAPCYERGWSAPDPFQYTRACYTDIPLLYFGRGLAEGKVPYFSEVPLDEHVEYPVLTGAAMWVTSLFVPAGVSGASAAQWYFAVNVLFLAALAAVTVVATARTVRHRPWDAALFALAPGLLLAGTINWDLWAVALTSLAMWAWARRHPTAAGVLFGLAAAAKFYPVLILGPLVLLGVRSGRVRAVVTTVAAGAAAWLAVNLPVMVLSYDGWSRFYRMSEERGASYGSIWLVADLMDWPAPDTVDGLNTLAQALLALCCLGIAALILFAPRRPRLAQVAFLVVAAFVLLNKVYSPQFVLWLLPLAALARPRWRDFLIWQALEVLHFYATWFYLAGVQHAESANRALPAGWYSLAVLLHVAGTLWFAGLIVRDVVQPDSDPVRVGGHDDPGGGVFDHAPDVWAFRPSEPLVVEPGTDAYGSRPAAAS